VPTVLKSGSLNLLELSGPVMGLLYLFITVKKNYRIARLIGSSQPARQQQVVYCVVSSVKTIRGSSQ
jgi:hypothetical protein